ncbi:TniQ family protein [Paraburkholderia sediminicola]|uniref:TniQ family protein n=1 Tax=Paraburkholderia sediminicola TaxID=458836 RepID=UPI0038B8A2E7
MERFNAVTIHGMGTPMMECSTGLVKRLAERAPVSTGDFLRAIWTRRWMPGNLQVLARADGISRPARELALALRLATGIAHTRQLTLAALAGFTSEAELIDERQRWCWACLHGMLAIGRIWEPLVWRIRDYETCHIHRTPLQSQCPACLRRRILPLGSYSRVGCCSACGEWLGAEVYKPAHITQAEDIGRSEQICRLITVMPQLSVARPTARAIVGSCIRPDIILERDAATLLDVGYRTVRNWKAGTNIPKLKHYLDLASVISVTLDNLLLNRTDIVKAPQVSVRVERKRTSIDPELVEQAWRTAIGTLDDISIPQVANAANVSITYVREHLPHLLDEAKEARRQAERARRSKKAAIQSSQISACFRNLVQAGIYPSYDKIQEFAGTVVRAKGASAVIADEWSRLEAMPNPPFRRLVFPQNR